jgi:hypothetical protein
MCAQRPRDTTEARESQSKRLFERLRRFNCSDANHTKAEFA